MMQGLRWLTVSPEDQGLEIVLALLAWFQKDESEIGKNPTVVLSTTDCKRDYEE